MTLSAVDKVFVIVVLLTGCAQVKAVEEFAYQTEAERLDALAFTDAVDVATDSVDVGDTLGADAADELDAVDSADVADAMDVGDVPGSDAALDAADATDGADADVGSDTGDGADAIDGCASENCDDGNPCTTDTCAGGNCNHAPNSGAACDVDACNVSGVCVAGTCGSTKQVNCDDGKDCTLDSCDALTGCGHFGLNNSSACADDVCMNAQACVAGKCQGGTAKNCDDGKVCTDDSCATGTGCVHLPNSATCDDGNACTGADACAGGTCAGDNLFVDATLGGAGDEVPTRLLAVPGGFAVVGTLAGAASDGWLFRTDANGKMLWQHTYGGTKADSLADAAVLPDGYALIGETGSKGQGDGDIWLVRTNSDGIVLWDQAMGGAGFDAGLGVIADASGLAFVGLSTDATGDQDGLFCHVSLAGDATWTVTQGGAGDDRFDSVAVAAGGYVLAGGTSSSGAGSTDFWLVRTDNVGGLLWQKTFGTTGFERAHAVLALDDGFLIAGTTDGKGFGGTDAWLVRTDSNGTKLWDKTYGGKAYDDVQRLIPVTGGFAFSGTTASTGAGGNDLWFVHVDAFGNKVIGVPYGTTGDDGGAHLVAINGGFVLGGYTAGKGAGGLDAWLRRIDLYANAACTSSGGCIAKSASDCSDGNTCTTDLCDAAHAGCWHGGADGMLCDDGLKCTGPDTCATKACSGSALNCDDKNPCTADSCDPEFGCVNEAVDGGSCGADACTNAGICAGGSCGGTTVVSCDDGKVCTDDSCSLIDGCHHGIASTAACDDAKPCTVADHCVAGACTGAVNACDDNNPCTADGCVPASGCVHADNSAACGDGNVCTNDSCDPKTGCVNAANTAPCDDKNGCTTEVCLAGECSATALANGTTCTTGSGCTLDETCSAGVCGEGTAKLFATTFGTGEVEAFAAIAATGDGFVLGGTRQDSSGVGDFWLIRTDAAGQKLWEKTFPEALGGDDEIEAVAVGTDETIVMAGIADTGSNGTDIRIVKANGAGVVSWDNYFGGAGNDFAASVVVTSDGGYAVGGSTVVNSFSDFFLLRTNAAGTELWSKTFGTAGNESGQAIVQTGDNGFAFVGYSNATNAPDTMVVRVDGNGNLVWSKIISGIGEDHGKSIALTSDGGFIIGGDLNSAMYLLRIDSAGNKQWSKSYGGTPVSYGASVVALSDGYALLGQVGSTVNDARLVRTDPLGNTLLDRVYGGPNVDYAYSLIALSDGFAFVGQTASLGEPNGDGWFIRTDAFGNTTCGSSGTCASQTLTSCDDTNPCTADTCDTNGCKHNAMADGTSCGTNKTCVLGSCF